MLPNYRHASQGAVLMQTGGPGTPGSPMGQQRESQTSFSIIGFRSRSLNSVSYYHTKRALRVLEVAQEWIALFLELTAGSPVSYNILKGKRTGVKERRKINKQKRMSARRLSILCMKSCFQSLRGVFLILAFLSVINIHDGALRALTL